MIFIKCKWIFIYIVLLFSSFTVVAANQTNFDNKIELIQKIPDINEALNALLTIEEQFVLTDKESAKLLRIRASIYFSHGDFEQALSAFQLAQIHASNHKLREEKGLIDKSIGVIQYYKGNNLEAINAYLDAMAFFTEQDTPVKYANLLNNIGLAYSAMGNTFDALDFYKKAELIYIEKGTLVDQIDIRGNIAEMYMRIERYDVAITLLSYVLEQRIKLKDNDNIAITHSALGVAYKKAKQYSKALEYANKSLEHYKRANKNYFIASELHNLSAIYNELNQPDLAIKYAKESIELAQLTDNKYAKVGALSSLAHSLVYKGDFDNAKLALDQSQEGAVEMEYQQQINDNLALYSIIFAAQKNSPKALESLKEYIEEHYKRSNDEINKQLNRFESDQLKEKVKNLEHINMLQELKNQKDSQERNLIVMIVLFVLVSAFYFYRRVKDRNSTDELAQKIKIRTHELEKLTEELKQANKVKSQFLANMSHEIRTPLTAIIGQSEAILSGEISAEFIESEVDIIHSNSLHVLDLINSILDLSKIEAGKFELDPHHQDLHVVFIELINMFSEQAKSKGLSFTINHRLPVPFILSIDAFRLKQILINICSNAIKFTHEGSVNINISVVNNRLLFKVSDTGIGLSDTQIQDVFNSFTQGDSSISRRFGGSGLGLCLSEQLANLMGGEIHVASELNVGSVFTLVIPCDYSFGVDESFDMTEVIENPFSELKNKCSGQIILADDHTDNLRLIARILHSLGLEVLTASNGIEAVELFLANKPKLILMDIQMPEMDGIEAFNLLQQKGCSVPIIALTANAMSHEVDEYLQIGFDGHLKKPIERDVFINTIVQYCSEIPISEEIKEQAINVDMSDLVAQFRSNLLLEQQDIVLHLNSKNYDKLAQLAHKIAGAGQMFGFGELSEKAIALEFAINNKHTDIQGFTQYLLNEIDNVLW